MPGGGHWLTQGAPSHYRAGAQQPTCLQPLGRATSRCPPTQPQDAVAATSCPPDPPASPQLSPASLCQVPPQLDAPSGCRVHPSSPSSPVLKPRPSAGHGLWFFQRLPKYQSLWFSTSPITCLSEEREGCGSSPSCRFREPKQTHCTGVVADGDHHPEGTVGSQSLGPCQGPSKSQGHPVLTRKLPKDSPELSNVSGKGDVGV